MKRWVLAIQKTGASYRKANTKAATDLERASLIDAIRDEFSGRSLTFRTKIREVRWKNGIAQVLTEPEFLVAKPSLMKPLRIVRSQPFEFEMPQETAVRIQPGTWLKFTGELEFHPRRYGAVGRSTDSQQMYDLRHEYLSGGYLGTFTTTHFSCTIDGVDAKPRWAKPKTE
ncbi:hypothetical protein RRSWK_05810 [Rhodopirellula sp. SWK7]|nr:hypothetical protein RRSWK_05810 [Rhodopirellula sp. SWK7]